MKAHLLLSIGLIACGAFTLCAETLKVRTWQTTDGERFEARYTGMSKQVALLRLTNGVQKAVWFAKLGPEDRQYVIEQLSDDEKAALGALIEPDADPAEERNRQIIERLDILRAEGQISDIEFQRYRDQILNPEAPSTIQKRMPPLNPEMKPAQAAP